MGVDGAQGPRVWTRLPACQALVIRGWACPGARGMLYATYTSPSDYPSDFKELLGACWGVECASCSCHVCNYCYTARGSVHPTRHGSLGPGAALVTIESP